MDDSGRYFLGLGLALALAGFTLMLSERLPLDEWLSRLPLGDLPGAAMLRRENFGISFPLMNCLMVSAVLSFLVAFFRR